ncbi:MAG: flagellar basal body rod protein FlgB [Candidatus Cellulosilyticum pullistercoris]|uniref:Flagellar basal body rod protein FlgB n=1 Tax=Candidatus Cellulosilyticum pullistercoris TaxID=2838521 RepID=A0A9E2NK53_9FIRM|nr:flagellar basal body rod protein FlgB [Candidatus Cellulosilyticum pullistercoris]
MDIFTNINLVNKAIDATLIRKELISQNISNVDTPNYKRQDIDFESVLAKEIKSKGVSDIDLNQLEAPIYTDKQTSSYRMDGNNVDIEIERSEETKVELRYNTLVTRITAQLNRFETILQNLK